ncbi:MAG: peptide ABC transporter substrate-binding protein [Planctomycetota bacterium]|nr:peptide ABC transporter substrate-binding protein [Planctomycetota bacterium]
MRTLLVSLALAAGAVVGAVLIAHRSGGPPADLVWTAGTEVTTLDPGNMTALNDGRVAAALFEGLTVLDAAILEPRPGVAERWQVSDDRLTYTFFLRPDARWSDGRPVTAEDFAYSWRRVLTPETAAEYAYMLYPIRGAKAYYEAALKDPAKADWSRVGVRVEGPHRLVVELERPTAYFLDLVAFHTYLPVRRDVVEAHGERWTFPGHIVSNGAYRLVSWEFRSRMRWEKNPYYWNADAVALERVESRVFEQPTTALLAYETGAVDLTTTVPSLAVMPLLEAQRAGRRHDVLYGPRLATYFYRFNCTVKPLSDPRVRRALVLAINRREIIDRAARGGQQPAYAYVPPGMKGYEPADGIREDVKEARRLLAEVGYPRGAGLGELAILVNKGFDHVPLAEVIQQQWRTNLGLDVRIEKVEWKVFLDMIHRLDYQIARGGWYGDYVDPNTFLDMFVTGGGNNETGWSNTRYDGLIAAAARETDPLRRMGILRRAERLLLAEVPIMPIYYYTAAILVRPGLEGVEPNLLNRIDFGWLRWSGARSPAARGKASVGRSGPVAGNAYLTWAMRLRGRVRNDGGREGR